MGGWYDVRVVRGTKGSVPSPADRCSISSPRKRQANVTNPTATRIPATEWTTGYCTNVHAGTEMESIQENLRRYAVPARIEAGIADLGIGLWLPATAAEQLAGDTERFATFLHDHRLVPYTINGFPMQNFHDDVVKHAVYQPNWQDSARLRYTQQLADILAALLPEDQPVGSISTLPLGWPESAADAVANADREDGTIVEAAGKHFRELAEYLKKLESRTGRRIVIAIEPEPGCILDSTDDVIAFFADQLPGDAHRRYMTVCHDICHSAVMMEPQAEALLRLSAAGISIGKVQVSSAVVADWQSMAIGRRREAIEQLKQFAEDRYLHQTMRQTATGQRILTQDLPELLATTARDGDPVWGDDRWVVHFHVPVFLERFGHLTTSHAEVLDCLRVLADPANKIEFTGHLEIETYAWSVLPASMRKRGLAEDIASELIWLRRSIAEAM